MDELKYDLDDGMLGDVSGGAGSRRVDRYRVSRGDTLFKLAMRYNTTVNDIMQLNPGVQLGGLLRDGLILTIPDNRG